MTIESKDVLSLLPARPRVLALGEPTHGENALLEVRNDLFRQLVEREGYRTIALESDCLMGLVADDYVTTGRGTLDEAMERGISHGWDAYAGNRELVRWMHAYNQGRPAPERVRFAGFDGPLEMTAVASPRPALTALDTFLRERVDADLLPCTAETLDRLLGTDDGWSDPASMMDPAKSVGRTPEARRLRLIADDLAALLEAEMLDDWTARLYARTATGLLRYHYWLADTSPGRLPWLLIVRASMMAANLLALAERGPVLAHAHNSHFQRDKSSMRLGDIPLTWWSAGARVSARLGDDYAFVATALGTIRHHGVDTPPPDTLEGLLYARPDDRFLVDPAALAGAKLTPRVSPWFGYAPLDPAHLAGYDGIVFVRETVAETP
jgi:erythromycin esterase-like protein